MAKTSTRRPVFAWLAACFMAAPAVPAFAQTRVVTSMEGFSAPVAPAAAVNAAGMGSNSGVSPVSFSAPGLFAAPSAPAASISRHVELGAAFSGPAAAPAAAPALAAASVRSHSAPSAAAAPAAPSSVAQAAAVPALTAASVPAPLAVRETAAASISQSRPESAREAAAIATVESGIADWTARAGQTLDAAPVLAAASEGTGPLERPSARISAEQPAPATPAPSKLKTVMSWAWPILAMTAAITSIDAGTKYFATHHLFTVFHECGWRTPFLMAIIPYIMFTAYKARAPLMNARKVWHWSPKKIANGRLGFFQDELSGMTAMIKDHPSLRWAVRLYDVSIALMVGGMLGNGIDALRLGGALDWIPLGRSLMNFADVALLSGLAFFQLGTSFFIKAAMAHKAGKPLFFNTAWFLGLPLAGVFIAWAFGSAQGGGALDLAMKNMGFIYLMGFSMLVGFSRFLAATVVNRFASRFVAEEGAKTAAQLASNSGSTQRS